MNACALLLVLLGVCVLPGSAYAGSLMGTLKDASNLRPLEGVVVTATAPGVTYELQTRTAEDGTYQFSGLPTADFTLRFEREDFMPYTYAAIRLSREHTRRVNVELLPSSGLECGLLLVPTPPQIDVGSTGTAVNIGQELLRRVPLLPR